MQQNGSNGNAAERDLTALKRRLALAADDFAEHAFIHHRCREELLSRLEYLQIAPAQIIDLGATDGTLSIALSKQFPQAEVSALEQQTALVNSGALRPRWYKPSPRRIRRIDVASLLPLPFKDDAADLLVANLTLARLSEPDPLLAEIARVLKPGGVFLFALPGPDTLMELRLAWAAASDAKHVATFIDMHDFGDALGRAGFKEPVLDVERLTIDYRSVSDLWRDLSAGAARNCLSDRSQGLTGRKQFQTMLEHLSPAGAPFSISVELTFGHCWAAAQRPASGAITIDPGSITHRRRRS